MSTEAFVNAVPVQFRYTRFCTPFGVSREVCGRPPPLARAVDHADSFIVNAAVVVS